MRGQPVLGMLIASLVDLYEDEWLGAVDAAHARKASLVTFVGRELGQPQGFEAAANAVYDLVSAEQLDGLIVWTTSLAQFIGRERMEEFCARFGDLPIASLEQSLPGIPSILMGDRNGMKEAVAHLIDVHGHRRIAFVRGAEHHLGAHQRYHGYVDALEEHGLAIEEELLGPKTSFYSPAISAWIEELLSDRGRRPDAIVVAHDDWALGVLSVLRASGTSVPQDIAVVGFDDVIGVRRHGLWLEGAEGSDTLALVDLQAAMLPLTTVHAPFRELGAHAVDSLLARLRGESVPPVETVPARLVVRHSCGCVPTRRGERKVRAAKRPPPDTVSRVASAVEAAVGVPHWALPTDMSQRLARAFVAEIRGEAPGQFLATFGELASTPQLGIRGLLTGFAILAALREAAGSVTTDEEAARAEAIWPRAEGLLEQIADRFSIYQGLSIEKDNEIVRRIGQKVIAALDLGALADTLVQELPSVGIRSCYLATYLPDAGRARSLLVYERGERITPSSAEQLFPATLLAPGGRLFATGVGSTEPANRGGAGSAGAEAGSNEPRSLVVLPLYFKGEQLGFVVFELGPRTGWIYEALQEQVSSSLEAALLVEREQSARVGLQKAHDELEERVAQRTAELARANETLTQEMLERARAEETRASLESQLRLAQKMEALGRLAGGIAHDFNNLLVVISGYSDLVLEQLAPDDANRRDVEAIRQAGEQAAALTRQLLAFGRKQVLAPRVLSLNDVVVGIEPMLRRLIGEDVELVVELAASLQPIRADQGQIEQVIVNLTLNARDAMPTGGRLRIATADVVRDETPVEDETATSAGGYVLLAVSDSGAGMDAETQARVFEPFFTTKSLGRGTGLGLATVFGIVRQSGGHIDVESTPGEGSAFRVYLPHATQAGEETEIEAGPTPGGRGFETILLVEDEPNVRGAVRRFLEQRGYHVVDASSGAEALRLFELNEGPIDLVVTDVVMPETSGPELIDRLGQIAAGIPVLYISGYTAGVISRQGLAEGTVALLEKPFTAEQLARKVRELLDRRRPAQAGRETG